MMQVGGGVDVAKQTRACWDYVAGSRHLDFGPILREGAGPRDAAAAIAAGEASVVVAAYRDPELCLTEEVARVGGTVEYVHQEYHARMTARSILAALSRFGWSAQMIARTVGANTEDVLEHLRRAGIRKPPKVDE